MKGVTLQEMSSYALTFVLVAIILGIGASVLTQIQETQFLNVTATNESINFASNNTYYSTANSPIQTVTQVANATYNIPSTRYTYTDTQIKIYTNGTIAAGTYSVIYMFENQLLLPANATGQGLTGTNTMSSWLPVIAVIVASAVVIGIVISAFRQ